MSRAGKISIRCYASGIVIALTLTACGGGGNNSGKGNSVAVSTPVSAAALTYGAASFTSSDVDPTASISATPNSGQASLQVHFVATDVPRNKLVVRYDWDFGDGNTASVADVSHRYDIPGRYTVRLTLTDSNEQTDKVSRQIYVSDNAMDNSQVIVPDAVYFFDDFNYSVQRGDGAINAFQNHGWNDAKAENLSGSGKGYLYTSSQIPGYSGPFPGKDSTYVLAIEARPSSFNAPTDFYLQFGADDDNQVPADVWFQYWIYINNYNDPSDQNDQLSRFGADSKFIRPSKDGFTGNKSLWTLYRSNNSKAPYANDLGASSAEYYMYLAEVDDISYFSSDGTDSWTIGQTDLSDHIVPNRWTLVKIHIDTSTINPKYEQWLKPLGGQWLKVAEYIQGQTANLNWHIAAADVGGHRAFRLPGVQTPCRSDSTLSCDSWTYLDDFSIATSEDSLPIYPY
ncbi:MAG TPA: PKD domain-containing protein [Gammaproteobacteria bacterium]|nr:PKD domain-containing protein [Gammaproteobacteria bacterium]